MSVIIRLQNLPWSANAADIRQFFHGLSIPEGGVHIVGGPLGDAFIAFSTDEDARQGMASDGGMLKDSRVKLYLSSRTEMQKIIEETRQQHLAMQASSTGMANMNATPSAAQQRPFTVGPFAPPAAASATHLNPPMTVPIRPTFNNTGKFQGHMDSSQPGGYQGDYDQQQASHPAFNPNQRMLSNESPGQAGGFPTHVNQPQSFAPHSHTPGGHLGQQHYANPRMQDVPLGPYGGQHVHGPASDMHDVYHPSGTDRFERDSRRNSRDTPPDVERSRDVDRGGFRGRDRSRRDRERDKDRNQPDLGRRGRRSRSRSGSRGRGRDRRRRSRSDSRERGRSSRDRDRDRNGKTDSKSGLLPTPAEQMENKQSNETAPDTSVQLRLLAGDLTYRDIRDYLNGIHVPNTCIKMINALDGYRFGLAYIRFTTKVDKQKALSRHNGMIRGYPVQIFHVEDSSFSQAIDSYSPGVNLDVKSLSNSCLSLRDFPPVATAQNVKDAFGTISIGQVLPERNESGTVTGLCYAELSSEADARKSIQLLKDGVMICGRQVKVAFLPLEELHVCARNLERLRGVVAANVTGSGPVVTSSLNQNDSPLSPGPLAPVQRPLTSAGRPGQPFNDGPRPQSGGNGPLYDPSLTQRGRPFVNIQPARLFISGLPLTAMERDIGDFFSDVGVIPQMIEIVYDEQRSPVGNAYCQFASMQEAERALDKNGGFMGGHTVSVTLVDNRDAPVGVPIGPAVHPHVDEMNSFNPYPEQLGASRKQSDHGPRGFPGHSGHPGHPAHSPHAPHPSHLAHSGHPSHPGHPTHPGHPSHPGQPIHPGHPSYNHPGPNGPYGHHPSMNDADPGNGFPNPAMGPRFGGPRFGGSRYPPSGNNGRGGYAGGDVGDEPRTHPAMNMRMRMQGGPPMPNGGGGGGGGGRGGSDDGSPTPGFGAPGCVVALANVPRKAIIADILDFFRGFQVNEKCVIRRFGQNGEPTGDARVAFPSPDEAELAVRSLQNEYLLNRRVMLSII